MRVLRAGASDPFGAFLCAVVPGGVKDLVRHWIDENSKIWNDPAIGWLIGPWPYLVSDVLETCNVGESARRTACRMQNNCAMTLAITPVASGVALVSVIGAPAAIVLPILGACCAAMLPVCKALCEGRTPNWNDVMSMGGALIAAGGALASGKNSEAMAQIGGLVATASDIGGDPKAAILAAGQKLTPKAIAKQTAKEHALQIQIAAIHKQAQEVKAMKKEAALLAAKDVQREAIKRQAAAVAQKAALLANAARVAQMTSAVQTLGQVGSLSLPQLQLISPVTPVTTNIPINAPLTTLPGTLPVTLPSTGTTPRVVIPTAAPSSGLGAALAGAGAGFVFGGPVGAAIGGAAGFALGKK